MMEGQQQQPGCAPTTKDEIESLRRAMLALVTENKRKTVQLSGIKGLVRQLGQKRKENDFLTERCQRLEGSLTRADNRIAQLNRMVAKNGEPSERAIVVPGVSKKVLESLARENTRLQQALNHLSNGAPNGVELAVANYELHEIIMKLREERDATKEEAREFKRLLGEIQDENTGAIKDQAAQLIEQVTRLKRNLDAKQTFCEVIVSENEDLKAKLQSLGGKEIAEVGQMTALIEDAAKMQPAIRDIMNQTWDGNGDDDNETLQEEDVERLAVELASVGVAQADDLHRRLLEETEKLTKELQETQESRDHLRDELQKAKDVDEENAAEINNLRQQLGDLQKKAENAEMVTRDHNNLQVRFEELQNEHQLMQMTLVSYEADFKKEREEKCKVERDREKIRNELGSISSEYERLQKNYMAFTEYVRQMHASPSTSSCPTRVDVPPPVPKSNELQCPGCLKMFPCNWLEDHMRDCTN